MCRKQTLMDATFSCITARDSLVAIVYREILRPALDAFQEIIGLCIAPIILRLGRQLQEEPGNKEIFALLFLHLFSPLV